MSMQPDLPRPRPPVVAWYMGYCVVMAVLYLLTVIMGLAFIIAPGFLDVPTDEWVFLGITGGFYFILGVVFLIPYAIAPFLPPRPWVWIYGLVLICIGITSVCCLPVVIPLLIYWIKPDVQAYFGRQT